VKKTTILAVIAIAVVLNFQVFAHDGGTGSLEDPVLIDWVGDISVVEHIHDDESPFKGSYTIYVKNTGSIDWGDFHFKIFDPYPDDGKDIDNVHFLDSTMPAHGGGFGEDPTSSQTLDGSSSPDGWVIDNVTVGATIDLFFYGDPVPAGSEEIVWFTVYTDNPDEANFGICSYPTPVPEPATIAILGLGGLVLILRRNR